MTAIPLPFVLAFVLVVLSLQLARAQPHVMAARPLRWLFAACILQSVLVGLRWSLDARAVLNAMAVTSAILPPLAWLALRESEISRRDWGHALPPLLVAVLAAFWRTPLDATLVAIYVGYIAALVALLRRGADGLRATPFAAMGAKRFALKLAIALLALLALIDAAIALDFAWNDGAAAPHIVAVTNLLTIACVAVVLVRLAAPSRQVPSATSPPPEPAQTSAPDVAAIDATREVDALLEQQGLFRDPTLGLGLLAKRAGRSPRELSAAINKVHGKNVSRYVNDFRVAAACAALDHSAEPVTNIMLDVGFQTKSNFNREFRRVTGMSPVQWRERTRGFTNVK